MSKQKSKPIKTRRLPWGRALLFLSLVMVAVPFLLISYVGTVTGPVRYSDASDVPAEPVAIVFGAGITRSNTPTPMLADRVASAVRLYQLGLVRKILMTGDGSRAGHDEVNVMRRYAESKGMPPGVIVLDYAGFSTYESCYRARWIFGITSAALVTQEFHLPRALYTCRQLGIDSVGLGTPDWGVYSDALMTTYTLREWLAILKALWDVHVARPLPTFMGTYEGWQLDQG